MLNKQRLKDLKLAKDLKHLDLEKEIKELQQIIKEKEWIKMQLEMNE